MKQEKILIVEDDLELLDTLKDLLTLNGYQVITATYGVQAFKLIKVEMPTLVIADIGLPGEMDGLDLLKKVQNEPELAIIPFLCLTARGEIKDFRKGMQLGADDYLIKPYDPKILLESIQLRIQKNRAYRKNFDDIQKNITSAIPHELFTPLNAIMGFSSLIQKRLEDGIEMPKEDIIKYMDYIYKSGQRLLHTSQNFTFYTRLILLSNNPQEKQKNLAGESNNPDQLLQKYLEDIAESYNRRNDIISNYHQLPQSLPIQREYLEKLCFEIIDNCFKFSRPGNKVQLRAFTNPTHFILELQDEGPGFPQKKLHSIGAFSRFDYNIHSKPGLGLGLTIVKLILELYSGKMIIQEVPAQVGTIFHIELPLA